MTELRYLEEYFGATLLAPQEERSCNRSLPVGETKFTENREEEEKFIVSFGNGWMKLKIVSSSALRHYRY
jgi:hypothetical protein